jgi:predicted dehydrogenase
MRNLMIIGVGFHARRIYVPKLMKLGNILPVKLVVGVDIETEKKVIDSYISDSKYDIEMLYLPTFHPEKGIPEKVARTLNKFVEDFNVEGVVISTEPLYHKIYAEWALGRSLHILMDKPVSIRPKVNTKLTQATGLIKDYCSLLKLYNRLQKTKSTVFSINVQRRYDNGFERVKKLIVEARDRFNISPTSIQAMHADGTWVFPKEILFQNSHPYLHGYGKSAHSGYHIFDMAWQLYQAGMVQGKEPTEMEVYSSSLSPKGFATNLSEKDYMRLFGIHYQSTGLTESQYKKKTGNYGEIDSFSILRLLRDGENTCNISINLLHSSFSQRAWAVPHQDLYKGNGRVKHQHFIIQQGPFQCIQVHNYQSKDLHDIDNSIEFDIGGNNHFDIYVFRNIKMFGSGKAFFKISSKDLGEDQVDKLVQENAKDRVIMEFVNFVLGRISKDLLRSNIDTHAMPVKIMSGVYQSSVQANSGKNPLVRIGL